MKKSINVKFKKLNSKAVVPTKAHPSDAGFDLVATSVTETENYIEYGLGIAVEIPEGHVGLIYPRSSVSNYDLSLTNCVPVIDSNFRGEIKLRFKKYMNLNKTFFRAIWNLFKPSEVVPITTHKVYEVGDKVGQLMIVPYPEIEFEEVQELNKTDRGENGFGSTDKVKRKRGRKKL